MISNSRIKELRARRGLSENTDGSQGVRAYGLDLVQEQTEGADYAHQVNESSIRDFRMYSGVNSFERREINDRAVINEMKRLISADPALRTMVARLPDLAKRSANSLGLTESTHDINKQELCRVLGLAMAEAAKEEFVKRT